MYEEYRTRMSKRGAYMGETMRKQTGRIVEATWMNSIYTRPVCVHAIETGLPPEYHSSEDFKETLWAHFEPNKKYSVGGNDTDYYLTFMPHTVSEHPEIKIGAYVSIPDVHGKPEYWLIVHMAEDNDLIKAQVLRCNWMLKWFANDKTYNSLCVVRSSSSSTGIEDAGYITSVDSESAVWLPTNADSLTIGMNTRFLISDSGRFPPLAWIVSKLKDTTPIGLTQIGLKQDLYNAQNDNAELMIADYKPSGITPEEPEVNPEGESFDISYSGTKPTIKVGGSAKTFTAQLPENNHFDIMWSVSDGVEIYGENSYENYTKTFGDYTVTAEDRTLRVKVAQNYDIVGTVLTIRAQCADGSVGEVKVEVVS